MRLPFHIFPYFSQQQSHVRPVLLCLSRSRTFQEREHQLRFSVKNNYCTAALKRGMSSAERWFRGSMVPPKSTRRSRHNEDLPIARRHIRHTPAPLVFRIDLLLSALVACQRSTARLRGGGSLEQGLCLLITSDDGIVVCKTPASLQQTERHVAHDRRDEQAPHRVFQALPGVKNRSRRLS